MVDEPNMKKPPLPPGGIRQLPPVNRLTPPMGTKLPPLPPKGGMASGANRPTGFPAPSFQPTSYVQENASVKDLEERFKKMEENTRDAEETKRKLERALAEMEIKLKEEKEKSLSQAIKAREEESLSLKMEQALKEMQEKARRDRREQELEETKLRAEEKVKDIERRLNEEREAWVMNLKKQMEMRDSDTKQVETQIESRFRDLERRWLEEKSALTQALRTKEDEMSQLKAQVPEFQAHTRRAQEDAAHSVELTKKKLEQELETKQEDFSREKRMLSEKLDMRERELVSLKAQLAMIDAQVKAAQDASARNLQDKERAWQFQLSELQKDLLSLRQGKEQMQVDFAKTNTENIALRKEVTEWEKKQNIWEQGTRDLKRKLEEYERLVQNHQTERQNWSVKLEEKNTIENILRKALADEEKKTLEYKTEKETEFSGIKSQKDKELAELKLEFHSLQTHLEKKYEKEKSDLVALVDRQIQEEVFVKTELAVKELADMRELVMSELAEIEKEVQQQQHQFHSAFTEKETDLASAVGKIKSMEGQMVDEKNFYESRMKVLEEEFMAGKQEQFAKFAQKLKEEQEQMNRQQELQQKSIDEKDEIVQSLKRQIQKERSFWESELGKYKSMVEFSLAEKEKENQEGKNWLREAWKYLTRTVIVLNLKRVPRILKEEDQEPKP